MTTVLFNEADDEDNEDEGDFRAFKFLIIITQSVACILRYEIDPFGHFCLQLKFVLKNAQTFSLHFAKNPLEEKIFI